MVGGGEGRGGDGSCDAMVFQEKNFFLWVRGGGGFVGDLLEGRKKAETRLIRGRGGGGVGVRGWGTSVHFPNCQGRYRLKKVETTIKPLLLGKTLPWNGFTVFDNKGTAVQFLRYLNSGHDNSKFTTEG